MEQTKKRRSSPVVLICAACKTDHSDPQTRDASCAVLAAEAQISHLYHNGGSADQIRAAQAARKDALRAALEGAR